MNKPIVVTGSSGLIGSQIVASLLERGEQVLGIDPTPTSVKHDNLNTIEEDILRLDWTSLFKRDEPHSVIHCAAHPGGKSLVEPALNTQVNAFGSIRLFEAAAKTQTPVIYFSSSVAYGPQQGPLIPESTALNPGTIYGANKLACEGYLKIFQEAYNLPYTVVRPFSVYGPAQGGNTFKGIANIFLTQMLEGKDVVVKGALERVRGLVYVTDVAEATADITLARNHQAKAYNICHPESITVQEVINHLCAAMGKSPSDFNIQCEDALPGDNFFNYDDSRSLRNDFNFTFKVDHKEGLSQFVESRLKGM